MKEGAAWIEFTWKDPVTLSRIQYLRLRLPSRAAPSRLPTASPGAPCAGPSETVRDYRILVRSERGDEVVATVTDNYQRLRCHDFEARERPGREAADHRHQRLTPSPDLRDPLLA